MMNNFQKSLRDLSFVYNTTILVYVLRHIKKFKNQTKFSTFSSLSSQVNFSFILIIDNGFIHFQYLGDNRLRNLFFWILPCWFLKMHHI